MRYICTLVWLLGFTLMPGAQAVTLSPYKDKLFPYPAILETGFGGDFLRVDYQVERDLRARDEVNGSRVKSYYISNRGRRGQKRLELDIGDTRIEYTRAGRTKNVEWIILYLHGQGGDRAQGMNDRSFGGNFNRLKNLAVRNNGLYITPTLTGFSRKEAQHISALMRHYARQFPKARILLACGSMGGQICWHYVQQKVKTPKLSGVFMLGAFADSSFLSASHALRQRVPLIFAHGTLDSVFDWRQTYGLFKALKTGRPNYPARLIGFETGKHGTPIRMIDWRREINWVLSQR